MKIFFILMFLFIIIAPFLYFLYKFKHLKKLYKNILGACTLFSLIIICMKIFILPNNPIFFVFTMIVQFYILSVFITVIILALYQLLMSFIHKTVQKRVVILCGVIAVAITSFGYMTHFHKVEKNYDIVVHKDTDLSSLRIAAISDMHLGTGTYLQDVNHLVDTINQQSYDVIFLIGDLFDESTPTEMVIEALNSLSHMKSQYGIYAVNGNHEHFANILDPSLYQKNNIQLLNENYVCVDGLFNIVGREDISAHQEQTIAQIIQGMDTSLPTFVLDHNPKRYQEMMNYADLQISGHTHAGQAFPLTLLTSPLYDDVYGLLQKNDFSLIVTSGYGSWGFPVRLLTHCEYLDIKITFTKK
jgi:predicted MPP superfamily phosphohydrolase